MAAFSDLHVAPTDRGYDITLMLDDGRTIVFQATGQEAARMARTLDGRLGTARRPAEEPTYQKLWG